jgi:hypothetical protein
MASIAGKITADTGSFMASSYYFIIIANCSEDKLSRPSDGMARWLNKLGNRVGKYNTPNPITAEAAAD